MVVLGLGTGRNSNTADNNSAKKLYDNLNLGGGAGSTNPGFTLNSQEQLSSDFIFCRARSQEL